MNKTFDSVQIERFQLRVGVGPDERLQWAFNFAKADLDSLTPGDWDNLKLEMLVFAITLVLWDEFPAVKRKRLRPQFGRDKQSKEKIEVRGIPTENDLREIQVEFCKHLGNLRTKGEFLIPLDNAQFRVTVDAFHPDGGLTRKLHKFGYMYDTPFYYGISKHPLGAHTSIKITITQRCLLRFGQLILHFQEKLKICSECESWFVAQRKTQLYCSKKCQLRVASRTFRGRKK